ncbi:MAG: zinc ABC transporter substrate-binding protein [Pseudobdellovibrionaceae bacterium]|nr:zinc ABC transporter substrate-binding protein [Bdellovibrionales bacterium]USN48016.1 MAG: zinc ABC transporter substrate-binding protein [Pseudobdellovibrionaceae bacterium]
MIQSMSRLLLLSLILVPGKGHAKLKVMTTTTNLKSLVESVGGDQVEVESFSRGTQDPHYIEAKPSYMLKAAKADLLVSVGLDLEVGWLPLIVRGSRNPKIREGEKGHFVAGTFIETLEKPSGEISRADGDVHPEGNPHFLLDPENAVIVGEKLRDKLVELDVAHAEYYKTNFDSFSSKMQKHIKSWQKRLQGKGEIRVITYHKTLTYFFSRFGIKNISILEPKPGIPPTASHILDVMKKSKEAGVKLALVENYFDPTIAKRVAKDVSGMSVKVVPVSVGGEQEISSLVDLYDRLVGVIEDSI